MVRRIGRLGAALGVLAMLASAGGAAAEELTGVATVEAKDLVLGTVTLDGAVFHVSDATRLVDANGRRIDLAQLQVAEQVQGAWLMSPDSSVEYEATLRPGGPALSSLRVLGTIPH
jgi:hypothetical protein